MSRHLRLLARVAAVPLAFALLYVAFFSPALFGGRMLAPGYSWPLFEAPRTPWTTLLFSGFPQVGDPQTQWHYPLNRMLSGLSFGWNAFVVCAYVLASCFTAGWILRLTGSARAAAAAALVYGMSGFMMGHVRHTGMIHAAAWSPLLLWSLEELRQRVSARWLALAALALGLCLLAGHPQVAVYTAGLAGAYTLVAGWRAPAGRMQFWGAAATAVALGLGLAAVMLLPALDLTALSRRGARTFDFFVSVTMPARQLPQILLPYVHGGFWNPIDGAQVPFFGRGTLGGSSGYVGLLGLMLAGVGCACWRDRLQGRFWAAVAVVALLASLGRESPVTRLLFYVPGYQVFRAQSRHLLEFSLASAVLAGLGMAALSALEPARRQRVIRRVAVGVAGLTALAYGGFLLAYRFGPHPRLMAKVGLEGVALWPWQNPAIGLPCAVLALGSAALVWWGRHPSGGRTALLLGVLVFDLASFGWFHSWNARRIRPQQLEFPSAIGPLVAELGRSHQRVVSLPSRDGAKEAAPVNRNLVWGVPSVLGDNPLMFERYSRLLKARYYYFDSYEAFGPESRVLDVLAVRFALVDEAFVSRHEAMAATLAALKRDPRWTPRGAFGGVHVYRNERALPRAWLVPEARALAAEAIRETIQSGRLPDGTAFDPRRLALVEEAAAVRRTAADPEARVEVTRADGSELELRYQSREPAFLVLSDAFYPGWSAHVDGQAAEIERTNYVLRGLWLPAGEGRVQLAFRSRSARVGRTVSAVSAALVLLGLLAPVSFGPARAGSRP